MDSDWWAPTTTDVADHEELWLPSREYMMNYIENAYATITKDTTKEQREKHMGGGWSITVMGPGDLACRLMSHTGYERILIGVYKTPNDVHRLYDILVRSNVQWVNVCKERLDNIRMCRLHDHSLTFLSPQMSGKFGIPYWRREFDALPRETVRWYHNEGQISGNIKSILKMGATAYEFGLLDAVKAKELFDGKVVMVGGINNMGSMLHGTPQQVVKEACCSIENLAPGGGFILQASGGQDINTPIANSDALYKAAMNNGRYALIR